jgi:ribulose-5-phosphate 4-epimerase/fuculose-1-phosphate aldolase
MADEGELKRELALGCRVLGAEDLGDMVWGHVSARASAETFWLKGATLGLEEIVPEDLVLLGLDGDVRAGSRPRHTEWPIHAEVLRARSDVGCVVHAHPVHANAFGATDVPLQAVSHDGARFGPGDVPRFTQTTDLIDSPELGRAVAACLGDGNALFLRNHGIVVAGPDVPTACLRAVFLERACRTQLLAMAAGVPYHATPPDELPAKRARLNSSGGAAMAWEYYRRKQSAGI